MSLTRQSRQSSFVPSPCLIAVKEREHCLYGVLCHSASSSIVTLNDAAVSGRALAGAAVTLASADVIADVIAVPASL